MDSVPVSVGVGVETVTVEDAVSVTVDSVSVKPSVVSDGSDVVVPVWVDSDSVVKELDSVDSVSVWVVLISVTV